MATPADLTALKINNETYPVYQASGEPNQYPLEGVNNMFLVKDATYATGWAWFDEEEFHAYYKWVNDPPQSMTEFSPVKVVEDPIEPV